MATLFPIKPHLVAWLLAVPAAVLAGCGDSGPDRAAITGQVTVGGQPLKAGRILFLPLPPTEGPATSLAVVEGAYRADRSAGPLIGRHRVEVEAALDLGFPIDDEEAFAARGAAPLPPQPIPPAFNRDSQLTVEVQAGRDNRYDVAIPGLVQSAVRTK